MKALLCLLVLIAAAAAVAVDGKTFRAPSPVQVEFFTMSKCPDAVACIDLYTPIMVKYAAS